MKISKLSAPFIFCVILVISGPKLCAQVGNNNPTGPSGEFNGSVTTGCDYDPYTANATRAITDMVVAGAVGQYGLSYSRTWNTRTPGWTVSHSWTIEASGVPGQPQSYVVTFPDGRLETFGYVATDPYYRATPGVRERLQPWTSTLPGSDFGYCYLILPDGGKVEFYGTRTWHYDGELIPPAWYEYDLTATAIIDPYGQRTTYSTNADGSFQITEPAGRWIKVYADYIRASDGREVHYTYQTQYFGIPSLPYVVLTSVAYYGGMTATYTYHVGNVGKHGCALATCDDPMYAGPMKKITYVYNSSGNQDGSWPVEGQIYSERSIAGDSVTTLTVIDQNTRRETRADGRQRTFTYTTDGYLTGWTDFKDVPSSQGYDSNKFVNSITDGNGRTTNFTNNPLTGVVTQVQYPATPNDTEPQTYARGTVIYTYGWAACPDPNNRDVNNPYYVYSVTDEAGHATVFTRDTNKRVTRIDYPDGGYETLSYNGFGQVLEHRLKTGGIKTFTYDMRGLRQTYRSPDTVTGNPTARYGYDGLDRLSGVTDVFGSYAGDPFHTTTYQYNPRGQLTVTTLPNDPGDGLHHTISNVYNSNGDGTLVQVTDQLNHATTYTYDEYRRLRSMTTPLRAPGDSTARTTYFSYDHTQGTADDYTHTDSNVTRVTLPSGNIVKTIYDENYRKTDVTASSGSGTDVARTSYGYDPAGNLTSKVLPDEQAGGAHQGLSTVSVYDERNRPMSVTDPLNHVTSFKYDASGRKKKVTQPNGQITTYDSYDSMNRLLQQTVQQTSQMNAVTQYTYEPATGLHMTMKDPHLVEINSADVYTFEYDVMGRAKTLTYPQDSLGFQRSESYTYDTAGRFSTYTNRDGKVQTFSYDNLHRQSGFTWSAGANTPNVTVGYDAANRVISISNANAVISRTYFDDNLLQTEAETVGGTANIVSDTWTADGQLGTLTYPSGNSYLYKYTGRSQLKQVQQNMLPVYYQAEYVYDVNGNLATRKVGVNEASFSVTTDASQRDALGRCTHLAHQFPAGSGGTRTFDYVFDAMGNRTSIQRDGTAETYAYDYAQQVTAGVDGGNAHSYGYDANGNRTTLDGGGSYTANNLNQQTTFNGLAVGYGDTNGNVTSSSVGGSCSYIYDAQNRLTSATVDGTTTTFAYDGLNRKVSQTVQGIGGTTTYNVWSGWNLIEERGAGNTLLNTYVYGAGEIIERINGTGTYFYYQDGQGSTSHLADATGALQEVYKYSTFGQPSVFAPNGSVRRNGSSYDVRHLFTGQLWMPQAGLYDYRFRVYSPSLTRFLQPDPIGFAGDQGNLYRYCRNNSPNRRDPLGLDPPDPLIQNLEATTERITVSASEIPGFDRSAGPLDYSGGLSGEGSHGDGGNGGGGRAGNNQYAQYRVPPPPQRPDPENDPFQEAPEDMDTDFQEFVKGGEVSYHNYEFLVKELFAALSDLFSFSPPTPPPAGPYPTPIPSGPPAPHW